MTKRMDLDAPSVCIEITKNRERRSTEERDSELGEVITQWAGASRSGPWQQGEVVRAIGVMARENMLRVGRKEWSGMEAVFVGAGRTPIPPPGPVLGRMRGEHQCCRRALQGKNVLRSPR